MAVRSLPWLDGFDYYATDRLAYKWASDSNIHVSPIGGRRNSGCIVPTGAGYLVSPDFEELDGETWGPCRHLSISFALFRQTVDAFKVIAQSSGSFLDIEFEITCSGRIGYREEGGTWYYTDDIVPFGEWCHVTLYYDADLYLYIRIIGADGTTLIDDLISGFDLGFTDNAGPALKSWRIEAATCGNWRMDDLYIHTLGFKALSGIGDCRIDVLEIQADDPVSDYAEWTFSSIEDFAYTVSQRPETVTANAVDAAFACLHSGIPHNPTTVYAAQVNGWIERLGGTGFYLTANGEDSDYVDGTATAETGYTHTWTQFAGNDLTKASVNAAAIGVKCSD